MIYEKLYLFSCDGKCNAWLIRSMRIQDCLSWRLYSKKVGFLSLCLVMSRDVFLSSSGEQLPCDLNEMVWIGCPLFSCCAHPSLRLSITKPTKLDLGLTILNRKVTSIYSMSATLCPWTPETDLLISHPQTSREVMWLYNYRYASRCLIRILQFCSEKRALEGSLSEDLNTGSVLTLNKDSSWTPRNITHSYSPKAPQRGRAWRTLWLWLASNMWTIALKATSNISIPYSG